MHNTSEKYLLQIEPKGPKSKKPVNDDLTRKMMELILERSERGPSYRGFHRCTGCGAPSTSYDLFVGPYTTNSLAVHYLRWHRDEVPETEIEKLKGL